MFLDRQSSRRARSCEKPNWISQPKKGAGWPSARCERRIGGGGARREHLAPNTSGLEQNTAILFHSVGSKFG